MALMDEVERRRFLDTLRNDDGFRAAVRRELELEHLRELPQQVEHLTNAISALIDDQAELRRSTTELVESHHVLHDGMAVLSNGIAQLSDIAGETLRVMDERFNVVEERFVVMDERFGVVDEDLGRLDEKVELRLGGLEERMERGFAATEAHFDQLDAAIAELRNERGT